MPDILCVGSVLWDLIGRTDHDMGLGSDQPGRIHRLPGGVALNIGMTLARFDLSVALLSAVGADPEGRALLAACQKMGLITDYTLIDPHLPTDRYMAIEAQGALIAALADAHSLERAGARILAALEDGRLGKRTDPWAGLVAIDGNLTAEVLAEIAESPLFTRADLRLAPASPGKARRLLPLIGHPRATIYVNCEEAGLITGVAVESAEAGAAALLDAGARRVLVTQGPHVAVDADANGIVTCRPPAIAPRRITGAGDTFLAAHIAAEARGLPRAEALQAAVAAAAEYVGGGEGAE